MKHAKYTPGPWRVKTGTYFNNEAEGDMSLREYKWVGAGNIGDEWPVLSQHLPENEANAQLISAAPDLLKALESLLGRISTQELVGHFTHDEIHMAVDAHKKATGLK